MRTQIVTFTLFCLCAAPPALRAQEFRLWNRNVHVHGFASQGFVYTGQNNWLTMKTSQGSAAFTDLGANISAEISDRFRIGAQFYDRNIGQIGDWWPELDWAYGDYRIPRIDSRLGADEGMTQAGLRL